jgi:hypothetical protein
LATIQQAIDLGGCNSISTLHATQVTPTNWTGTRTEFVVPAAIGPVGFSGTVLLSFTDASSRVNCQYSSPSGGLANSGCSVVGAPNLGTFGGSRVPATRIDLSFVSGSGDAYATISYTANDFNECTQDTCPNNTKTNDPNPMNGAICGAADACYTASTCGSGTCGSRQALPVDDGDPCTSPDHCDSQRGMWGDPNGLCSVPFGVTQNDPTHPTDFGTSVAFIYNGGGQTGVQQNAIDSRRASVVAGRVVDANGAAVALATVKVLNHPELGQATTRSDGRFDIVVNGGGDLVMDFVGPSASPRYLEVQRHVNAYWHDYTVLDDLVMLRDSTNTTTLHRNQGTWQTATGDSVTEGNISRQARVLFPPGWDIVPPSNWVNPPGPNDPLTFTSIEYTGASPAAMPGDLPPTSNYTYASEFAFQEAVAAGVGSVPFVSDPAKWAILYTQPVLQDTDPYNAPGSPVPTGTYDTSKGVWVAEETGRVVQIASCASGSEAVQVIANYGNQQQSDYDAIGMTAAERQQLCQYYAVNTKLWRVRRPHFSSCDLNWGALAANASAPPNEKPHPDAPNDCPSRSSGSIIECENQILGEEIPIPGTPYSLRYQSDKQLGFWEGFTIRVTPDNWGGSDAPDRIELRTEVAGRYFVQPYLTQTASFGTFVWDRKDRYGREVQGSVIAHVELRYVFTASNKTGTASTSSFGGAAASLVSGGSRASREIYVSRFWTQEIGLFDAKGLGFGGWTVNANHVYDPTTGTLFMGDGHRRTATPGGAVATTVVAGGTGASSNGSQANGAQIDVIGPIAMGADGTMYVTSHQQAKIFTVNPVNGQLGTAQASPCTVTNWSDGSLADGTCIGATNYDSMAVAPDDSIYFSDTVNIYKLSPGPSRTISLVAGGSRTNFTAGFSGDGQKAAEGTTKFWYPYGLAVARDGTLYVADQFNHRIRRIGTDGVINSIAGNSTPQQNCVQGQFPVDGQLAAQQPFCWPESIAIGPDGSLYVSVWDSTSGRIIKIGNDGRVKTVAGTGGQNGPGVDNVAATTANLHYIHGLTFDPSGNLYLFDGTYSNSGSIRRIDNGGMISTVVDASGWYSTSDALYDTTVQDNQLARSTSIYAPWSSALTFGSDGYLYWSENRLYVGGQTTGRVRKVRSVGNLVPAEDGSAVYEFDSGGKHQKTHRPLKGGTARDFHYDSNGYLDTITEYSGGSGNATTLTHGTNLITITPPFNSGLQTTITLDPNSGYATRINFPIGHIDLTYSTDQNGNPTGLLKTLTDQNGNVHNFVYQLAGRLIQDTNPLPASSGTQLASTTDEDISFGARSV